MILFFCKKEMHFSKDPQKYFGENRNSTKKTDSRSYETLAEERYPIFEWTIVKII